MRLTESGLPAASTGLPGRHELESWLTRGLDQLLVWYQRMIERRQLAGLNEIELRDVGLSRGDVVREISKPFWRA